MASPLTTARDQIVTLVEAILPPTNPAITYHYYRPTDGRFFQDGASFARNFVFELEANTSLNDMGGQLAIEEWSIKMILRLNAMVEKDGTLPSVFDALANEPMLIKRAVNELGTWPTGVDFVWIVGFKAIKRPSENYDVIFQIVVRTQET